MKKKKILFIYKKPQSEVGLWKQQIHISWVESCKNMFDVQYWGKGYTNTSLKSLQNKIDSFKPNYIYMTMRKRYTDWLPDLMNIKVPIIYVECDEYKYYSTADYYKQFDRVLCRQPVWGMNPKVEKIVGVTCRAKIDSWEDVPILKWSVPLKRLRKESKRKKGRSLFIGKIWRRGYSTRKDMYEHFGKDELRFKKIFGQEYWNALYYASKVVCPTESDYGNFIPAKIFEFLAAGPAVLSNCDLTWYGCPDLDKCIIKYKDIKDLKKKLQKDFIEYRGIAYNIIRRKHIDQVRYKELFK